jgi:hypothetical protein
MTVTESNKTVTGTVPLGTAVTALKPTIDVSSGATVSPASGVAADFSAAVTYTVTAQDGTTAAYVVTVSVTPSVASCAGVIGDGYVAIELHVSGPTATVRDISTNMTIVDASGSQVAVPVAGTWTVDGATGRITGWTFAGTGTFKLWGSDAGPAPYFVISLGTIDQNGTTVGHVSVVPAATPDAAPVVGGVLGMFAQGAEITGAQVYRGTITTTTAGTYNVYDYADLLLVTGTVSDAGVFCFFLSGESVMFCASFIATSTQTEPPPVPPGASTITSVYSRSVGTIDAGGVYNVSLNQMWDDASRTWGTVTEAPGGGATMSFGADGLIAFTVSGSGTVDYPSYRIVTTGFTIEYAGALVP